MANLQVKTDKGLRPIDFDALRMHVREGRLKPTSMVVTIDGGATFMSVEEALMLEEVLQEGPEQAPAGPNERRDEGQDHVVFEPAAPRPDRTRPPAPAPLRRPSLSPAASDVTAVNTPVVAFIDSLLARARVFDRMPEKFDAMQTKLAVIGTWLTLVAGGLVFCCTLVCMGKSAGARGSDIPTSAFLVLAICTLVGALVLHYIAARFAIAGRALIKSSPYHVSSTNVTDCMGLLFFLAGAFFGIENLILGIQFKVLEPVLLGLVLAAACWFLALLVMSPRVSMNIIVGATDANSGETALGVIAAFARTLLNLGPAALVVGTAFATLTTLFALYDAVFRDTVPTFMGLMDLPSTLALGGMAPFVTYMLYLIITLTAEVMHAIFAVARNTQR